MSNDTITYTKASGVELERIIGIMEHALINENPSHVTMACLAVAIMLQSPDISAKQLVEGVKGASEWIALFVSSVDQPLEKAN